VIDTALYSFYTGSHNFRMRRIDALLWWVSVAQAQKHFTRVELLADARGAEILGQIGLPFDRVRVGLADIAPHLRSLWTHSKLYALRELAAEGARVMHLDPDVFWWQAPPERVLTAQCCMQGPFPLRIAHLRLYDRMVLPPRWIVNPPCGHNSGMIGSDTPERLHTWATDVLAAIENPLNAAHISSVDYFIAASFAEETSQHGYFERIQTLFPSDKISKEEWAAAGYTHLAGGLKYTDDVYLRTWRRMRREHPEALARIEAVEEWEAPTGRLERAVMAERGMIMTNDETQSAHR
jgi:hypothetical protein